MPLILGLDIGSSSCKSCLLRVDSASTHTYSNISSSIFSYEILRIQNDPTKWEIPVKVILDAIQQSIKGLNLRQHVPVEAIAISGQMHGCVLWTDQPWIYDEANQVYLVDNSLISNLYSWQDQRCDSQFIDSLPMSPSQLATGFGIATIFWLQKYEPEYLSKFNRTGTIMDFIVTLICQLNEPLMSIHNAAGFGFYNFHKKSWSKTLDNANFPTSILPKIVEVGQIAGELANDWLDLPKGIPVYAAFGDLQCSTYSCIQDEPNSAVLTMSTSLQLIVNPTNQDWFNQKVSDSENVTIPDLQKVSLIPYVNDSFIVAAASLNGGNVLEAFVNFVQNWLNDLIGSEFPKEKIWLQLNQLNHEIEVGENNNDSSSIKFIATLFGERYDPQLRSSLVNISTDLTPQKLFKAICRGLIENVFTMIPIQWLTRLPINEIKATGGALLRNNALKIALETICSQYGIKVNFMQQADAHIGAALLVARFHCKLIANDH